eukprot:PhM_4_TR9559/c0_g2_i1/m.15539
MFRRLIVAVGRTATITKPTQPLGVPTILTSEEHCVRCLGKALGLHLTSRCRVDEEDMLFPPTNMRAPQRQYAVMHRKLLASPPDFHGVWCDRLLLNGVRTAILFPLLEVKDSGFAVEAVLRAYSHISASDVLVLHDHCGTGLELGQHKVQRTSMTSHLGVRDVIAAIQTTRGANASGRGVATLAMGSNANTYDPSRRFQAAEWDALTGDGGAFDRAVLSCADWAVHGDVVSVPPPVSTPEATKDSVVHRCRSMLSYSDERCLAMYNGAEEATVPKTYLFRRVQAIDLKRNKLMK